MAEPSYRSLNNRAFLDAVSTPSPKSLGRAKMLETLAGLIQALSQYSAGALSGGGGQSTPSPALSPGVFNLEDTPENRAKISLDQQLRKSRDEQAQRAAEMQGGPRAPGFDFLMKKGDVNNQTGGALADLLEGFSRQPTKKPFTGDMDTLPPAARSLVGALGIPGGQQTWGSSEDQQIISALRQGADAGVLGRGPSSGSSGTSPNQFFDRMMRIQSAAQRAAENSISEAEKYDATKYQDTYRKAIDEAYKRFGYQGQEDFARQLISARRGLEGGSPDELGTPPVNPEDIADALIEKLKER